MGEVTAEFVQRVAHTKKVKRELGSWCSVGVLARLWVCWELGPAASRSLEREEEEENYVRFRVNIWIIQGIMYG